MRISTTKVKAARNVLKALNKRLAKVKTTYNKSGNAENYLALDHYQNCREQGFMVVNWRVGKTRWVAFSENRNSDSIVVYPSVGVDAFVPMQGMTGESWNNRVYFGSDEADKAAEFCVKHLLG